MSFVSIEGGKEEREGRKEKSFINLLVKKIFARKQVYCKTIFACGR